MKHVMIDIETLGRNAGCVVMSIAAVEFNPIVPLEELTENGHARICNKIDSFYRTIDVLPQLFDGAEIEPATLEWWRNQGQGVKNSITSIDSIGMKAALSDLSDFLEKNLDEKAELTVWAQGTDFYIAILRHLFNKYFGSDSEPWCHTKIRDSRTFIFTMGDLLGTCRPYDLIPKLQYNVTHCALDDATRAAYNVAYLYALYQKDMKKDLTCPANCKGNIVSHGE